MSLAFENALQQWRDCRAEYEDALLAQYIAAADECRGALVNRKGQAKGIDSISLFMGNRTRAYCYASEELVEYWQSHPRVTFADFERQWIAAREHEPW